MTYREREQRWIGKTCGAKCHLAGRLNGRQGYVLPPTFWTPNRGGGIGRADVLLEPIGATRLQNLWIADLRLEKAFDIRGTRLSAMVDIFNLFNAATVLAREKRQNLDSANEIRDILSPRILRFGVRFTF